MRRPCQPISGWNVSGSIGGGEGRCPRRRRVGRSGRRARIGGRALSTDREVSTRWAGPGSYVRGIGT